MSNTAVTLDVRSIEPRFRHPLIFGIFDALPPGQGLLLTNDHDPKPRRVCSYLPGGLR